MEEPVPVQQNKTEGKREYLSLCLLFGCSDSAVQLVRCEIRKRCNAAEQIKNQKELY